MKIDFVKMDYIPQNDIPIHSITGYSITLYRKSMKFGIQEELLLSFLDTKLCCLPDVQND